MNKKALEMKNNPANLPELEINRQRVRRPLYKRSKSHRVIKKEPFLVPGPASYDIRGNIELGKGFTFKGRYKINEMKDKYAPGYVSLKSDFDSILDKPKFGFKKSFAPRFKEPKIEEPGDYTSITKKFEEMNSQRLDKLGEKIDRIKDRDRRHDMVRQRKEEIEEMKMRKYEDYLFNEINYVQVEENAPKYSMLGKSDKGFLNIQENYDDPTKLYGLEQSVSYLSKNLTKNLNPIPDLTVFKPNLPSYSIPKGERFVPDKILNVPGPGIYYEMTNGYDDKPGSKKQL